MKRTYRAYAQQENVMGNVYVVIGSTGEYSDRDEWPVCAYLDEDLAKAHVVRAGERAAEIHATRPSRYEEPTGTNEHDPGMKMDYTGTFYHYWAVPLTGGEK
jgi:hypothetical protein